ncbi:MAG: zf-HC2 domain-containing protein [Eubacteriales bacterium]
MTNDKYSDCGYIRALLNEYIDGELRGEQLEALEGHIAACEGCRAELEELSAVKRLVAQSALPSPGIASRVMEQINSGKVKMQKNRRFYVPFGTLAALAAVLVFMAVNRNIFGIFSDKTNMDDLSGNQSVSDTLKKEGADTGATVAGSEEMRSMLALPEDAQFAPPAKSGAPAVGDAASGETLPDEVTQATQPTEKTENGTESEFGDGFQVEMDMNALAQKVKEESGFSVITNRTYSVHLPEDYTVTQLLEGFETQEDSGIYILNASDEVKLKDKLDSIPDALYNSYAEVPDSDKIAVIIVFG